jgi:hypothetical protein
LFYPRIKIFREQHDQQSSFLASKTYKMLDKTRHTVFDCLLPDITHNRADQMIKNTMLCQPTTVRAKSTIAGSNINRTSGA